jgi:hypothetical protein
MTFYSMLPVRRSLQIAGDLVIVGWLVLWPLVGNAAHDATAQLADPGRQVAAASTSLAGRLHASASAVADLPIVGDAAASPLDEAGAAAAQLAGGGRAEARGVDRLAGWLGWTVALVPIFGALVLYVPRRIRFVRRASAARALVRSSRGLDLLALQALTHQPLHRVAAISEDPAADWRERDPETVLRLAELELADLGLRTNGPTAS